MSGAVGFIGLGNIGAPMATRLLDWPDGLVVFDVHAPSMEPFVEKGATAAASPAEVAAAAQVICIVVQNEAQVREVLDGIAEIAGRQVPHEVVGRRAGDPIEVYADPTYAFDTLGWKATYRLPAILESAYRWHQTQLRGNG